jgi:hypothetical protein
LKNTPSPSGGRENISWWRLTENRIKKRKRGGKAKKRDMKGN